MVYGVVAMLAFTTGARRDSVLGDIEARIANRPRWGVTKIESGPGRLGPNTLQLEMRFQSRLDADDLFARIDAFATGQRLPVAGSWMTIHDCTHDEGSNVCANVARRDW